VAFFLVMRSLSLFFLTCLVAWGTTASASNTDSLYNAALLSIYRFKFKEAESCIRQFAKTVKDPVKEEFLKTNLYWWLIVSGEQSINNKELFHLHNSNLIAHFKDSVSMNNQENLAYAISAHAFKVRMELLEQNRVNALFDLNKCIKYLKPSFGRESENHAYFITSGLYNYYFDLCHSRFPLIRPYLKIYPKGNAEHGIKFLLNAFNSEDAILKTEAAYHLMKIQLEGEEKPHFAELFSNWLTERYPENLIFRYYHIVILLNQSKTQEAKNHIALFKKLLDNPNTSSLQREHFSNLLKDNKATAQY
jgi:hypothetical protein